MVMQIKTIYGIVIGILILIAILRLVIRGKDNGHGKW